METKIKTLVDLGQEEANEETQLLIMAIMVILEHATDFVTPDEIIEDLQLRRQVIYEGI